MLVESIPVSESRQSLKAMQSDLDRIEASLLQTNRRFIESRRSAWQRARATTAIYLANIRIQSRFKFWQQPDTD